MDGSIALVIGGSVAGMCAASALGRSHRCVVVLDQDALPVTPQPRRGVPQASFVHSLLERGRRELEALFPGFNQAMLARGVPVLDFGSDVAALRSTAWIKPAPTGLQSLWPSRSLLETVVRRLLLGIPNIEVRDRVTVTGLVVAGAPPRVLGLRIRTEDGAEEELRGDLVVDASGRGSKAPAWLRAIGVAPPPEERVDAHVGYSARLYRAPPPASLPRSWWWKGIVIECAPPGGRTGGVLLPVEDGGWLVTLMGFNREYPPSDEAGFLRFTSALRSPLIAQAIARAEPISDIRASRSMVNCLRRYDRWPGALDGFVALGDSVCSFNPVYGQGMTAAAVCASLLGENAASEGSSTPGFATRFHRRQGQFIETPWRMATASDVLFPGTEGEVPREGWLRERYVSALFETAWEDPAVHRHIVRVFHLVSDPTSYFDPWVIRRVLAATARRRLAALWASSAIDPMPPAYAGNTS